jgi:hypothetical protein
MYKFEIGDKVLHLADIQSGTIDIGTVIETNTTITKIQWKNGGATSHPTQSLVLAEKIKKQNHPYTTIFK